MGEGLARQCFIPIVQSATNTTGRHLDLQSLVECCCLNAAVCGGVRGASQTDWARCERQDRSRGSTRRHRQNKFSSSLIALQMERTVRHKVSFPVLINSDTH